MKKKELEILIKQLEKERDHFVRELDVVQKAASQAVITLEKTLRPLVLQGEFLNEKDSEQAATWDRAIKLVMRLVRVTHLEAITERLVEPISSKFLPQAGDHMQFDASLKHERPAQRIYEECDIFLALKHLVEVARLYLERNDTCSCVELSGVKCLACDTNKALNLGEYWLRILDKECEDLPLPPQQTLAWEST